MDRKTKRDSKRLLLTVKHKAVKDMNLWLEKLEHDPTPDEIRAYQAGYIAGTNRASQQ